jgi:hypothetical protein
VQKFTSLANSHGAKGHIDLALDYVALGDLG